MSSGVLTFAWNYTAATVRSACSARSLHRCAPSFIISSGVQPDTAMNFGVVLLFYGLYYGIISRDFSETCMGIMWFSAVEQTNVCSSFTGMWNFSWKEFKITSSCYATRLTPTARTYRNVENSGQTTIWQEFLLIISLQYTNNILEALSPGGFIGVAAIVPHFYTRQVC